MNNEGETMKDSNRAAGPSTRLTAKFSDAVAYAAVIHGTQVRKGTDVTYLSHLLGVASLVLEAGGTQDEAIAGLLHDAVEDAGGLPRLEDIRVRFGDVVADIVLACSDSVDEEWKARTPYIERKQRYLDHLADPATSPRAVLVSIADKVHNARATVTDLERYGVSVLEKFNTPNRGLVGWYYRELLRIGRERGVTDVLTIPLALAVEVIEGYLTDDGGEQTDPLDARCPACGAEGDTVIYGLPAAPPGEHERLGGCLIDPDNPDFICPQCETAWQVGPLRIIRLTTQR